MQTQIPTNLNIDLKIGEYTVHPIPTGLFGLDGGAMFGTVPKVLWEKSNPPDQQNRIQMEARALLLKSPNRCVLIDTGNGSDFIAKYGDKLGSKFAEIYGVDTCGPSLIKSLTKYGVTAHDVTDVILTHLHFDHAGGATQEQNNDIVPTFPNASYYVQTKNLESARQPNVREKASYLKPNFEPLEKHNVLKTLDGSINHLLPNINLWVSNGHTQGHQVVILEDENQRLIYCGDVIPTSSHIRSAWIMGYDLDPLKIIEEKIYLLSQSLDKKTFYFFEHDPYCDLATVEQDKNEFKVKDRFWLS